MNPIHPSMSTSNPIVERSQIRLDSVVHTSGNLREVFQETAIEHIYEEIGNYQVYKRNPLREIRDFFNKYFADKNKTGIKKLKQPLGNIPWTANPTYKAIENIYEDIENYQEIEHIYEEIGNYQVYKRNPLREIRDFFNKYFADKNKTGIKKLKQPLGNIPWTANPAYEETRNIRGSLEDSGYETPRQVEPAIYEEIGNIRGSLEEDSGYEIPRQVEPAIYLEVLP